MRRPRRSTTVEAVTPPLIATADEALLDELLRLTAAAGVTPEVVPDAGAALRAWGTAPLVLVGPDLAAALARLRPGRREDVLLVGWAGGASETWRLAVEVGAGHVVELPGGEARLAEALADLAEPGGARGVVVGVVGGSGGAGATTFACALGQLAARSGPVLLVDADPHGPGLDRMLGLEEVAGVRWSDLRQSTGRLAARSLRAAVPRRDRLGAVTWWPTDAEPPSDDVMRETLASARRGHDLVVVDLPRADDARIGELVARCDELVLLARPTLPGLTSAARLCARHPGASRRIVLRGRGLDELEAARVTGVDRVVAMPDQRGVDEAVGLGLGPLPGRRGPLARAAREVLTATLGREGG